VVHHLERYSDFENRPARGRTYVRNGSVSTCKSQGRGRSDVAGSDLYKIKIAIAPVKNARWKAICRDCAGSIDSLVELLQGRLAEGRHGSVCREGDGLFPSPAEISSTAAVRTGPACASTLLRFYMELAPARRRTSVSFWLARDENELIAMPDRVFRWSRRHPVLRRC